MTHRIVTGAQLAELAEPGAITVEVPDGDTVLVRVGPLTIHLDATLDPDGPVDVRDVVDVLRRLAAAADEAKELMASAHRRGRWSTEQRERHSTWMLPRRIHTET